ncbi:MAG: DUF1579 domain-containing protein [Planctomycetes bacterium]|nr:DUF1579 domain-containing protein [Planctomycetota bacterium]
MKFSSRSIIGAAFLVVLSASAFAVIAQDKAPQSKEKTSAEMTPERASTEHALLKKWVGAWDAEVTNHMTASPEKSKGTMTCRAVGELWLVSDFKGEHMGQPFEGHEVCGWDSTKRKYSSVWVDTMKATATIGEGTYDASTRTLTTNAECVMNGKKQPMTHTIQWKDDNHITMTMKAPGPDGKPMTGMTIEYKRRN